MKIKEIEQDGDIFTITVLPNWMKRTFLLKKAKKKKYKDTGELHALSDVRVYVNQEGEVLGRNCKITVSLENWRRRF